MMYLQMFWEFFKTGLFAVGGGMATIPFLYEMSEKTGWFTGDQLANMIAVGESTPGPIGVNMATYVGFLGGMQNHGIAGAILGAVVTTLGLITPSVIIIMVIAALLKGFRDSRYVQNAFYGLRPASSGLIAAAGIQVVLTNLVDFSGGVVLAGINWKGLVLGVALWLLSNQVKATKKLHPIAFIGMAAVAGIVFQMG